VITLKTREIVGCNVKIRREQLLWTVEGLSEKIGMGWQTVDRIEKGFGTSLTTIDKLAKALNCSIQDLFGEVNIEEIEQSEEENGR